MYRRLHITAIYQNMTISFTQPECGISHRKRLQLHDSNPFKSLNTPRQQIISHMEVLVWWQGVKLMQLTLTINQRLNSWLARWLAPAFTSGCILVYKKKSDCLCVMGISNAAGVVADSNQFSKRFANRSFISIVCIIYFGSSAYLFCVLSWGYSYSSHV